MTLTLIEETLVAGKRLGRHIDGRLAQKRADGGPPPLAPELKSVKHASSAVMPLDQGELGSCTANALAGALNTAPHWKAGQPVLLEQDALRVYAREEQDLFGSPYPPTDQGGSGQAVCEAGEQEGWCSSFQVATGIQEALLALVLRPVITGVDWYTSFDEPVDGLVSIAPGATVRGGHEIVATELEVPVGVTVQNMMENLDRIRVGLWQSWGPSWGLSGRFYWTAATWDQLLKNGGDVVVPRTRIGWVRPSELHLFKRVIDAFEEAA